MKKCILCGESADKIITVQKSIRIFECTNCSLGISERLSISKRTLYGSGRFYSISGILKKKDKHISRFEHVIETLSIFASEGKVLDVGGGFGLFSSVLAQKKKHTITMLEPHLKPYFVKTQKKVHVIKKSFQKFVGHKKTYDAITFLDVLEHFKNPLQALEKANRILRAKGIVIILLPNYKSLMQQISRNWPWWMIEDHYYHFSRASLKRVLEKSGFTLEYLESFETAEDMWLSLQGNYKFLPKSTTRKLIKILTLPVIFLMYLLFRPILWKLYNGGLLLAVARKK